MQVYYLMNDISGVRYIRTSADKLMGKYLSVTGTQTKQEGLTLGFLSISLLLIITAMNDVSDANAQTTSSTGTEKKDIFKVMMTVQGLNHNTGDVVTIVAVNGESRVKLFDDSKTYIHSVNSSDGTGGILEYVATFPNVTVGVGEEYKVCALTINDSNLICETGANSPALRPEFKDLYIQEAAASESATSQAAMASDED